MNLRTILFPPSRRHLPYGRWWNITARTLHLAATGALVGGHLFAVPADQLYAALWTAIASGAGLIAVELYSSGHWLHQGCALALYAKLAVLCVIPIWWEARVPLLLAALALASVGSHAPRTLRHYSVVYKRVMAD